MLVDWEYRYGQLILSHVADNKQIKLRYYKWPNPTKYIICDNNDHQRDGRFVFSN